MKSTHTLATLEVSAAAYDEIAGKLRAAEYGHAFIGEGVIDMSGVGLVKDARELRTIPAPRWFDGKGRELHIGDEVVMRDHGVVVTRGLITQIRPGTQMYEGAKLVRDYSVFQINGRVSCMWGQIRRV